MPSSRAQDRIRRLGVVGVGMMGGSVALAARERAKIEHIVGYDTDASALAEALDLGVINEAASSAKAAAAGADLAVVSTPVRTIPRLVEECACAEPAPRLITDMGSTKTGILRSLSPAARVRFIGGHPMRGAADSGVRYARPDLFEGATYFLCSTDDLAPDLYGLLQGLLVALGARPIHIEPEAHDRIVAVISHLPHVLANTLMEQAGGVVEGGKSALQCAGASFTDLTRVAGANPQMWRDIFLENGSALGESLEEMAHSLQVFAKALQAGDAEGVSRSITSAAAHRQELLELSDIKPDTLHKVTVLIPDEPGVIARVMTELGAAQINVEDLTLHHMNRSVGGDLEIFVSGKDLAEQAADLLNRLGYPSSVSVSGDGTE